MHQSARLFLAAEPVGYVDPHDFRCNRAACCLLTLGSAQPVGSITLGCAVQCCAAAVAGAGLALAVPALRSNTDSHFMHMSQFLEPPVLAQQLRQLLSTSVPSSQRTMLNCAQQFASSSRTCQWVMMHVALVMLQRQVHLPAVQQLPWVSRHTPHMGSCSLSALLLVWGPPLSQGEHQCQ
jgi:hypothetical protein